MLVLRCGVLIDGTGASARERVDLMVDGDRILDIRDWSPELDDAVGDVSIVDCRDMTVIPGLIDAHVHLCVALGNERGEGTVRDSAGVVAWGLAGAMAALRSGVTCVVDVGSPDGLALRVAELIDSGVGLGPKVIASGAAITTTAGHGAAWLGALADNSAELVSAVRRAVAQGAGVIKIMVTGGSLDPESNRRRAQYSEEELRAAIADAHRLNKRVIGHANATEGITRAVLADIDVIAHCNWLGTEPNTIVVDRETVDKMVDKGIWVDLNLEGAMRDLLENDGPHVFGIEPGFRPQTRWELLQPLQKQGLRLYFTSDEMGPALGTFPRLLTEWRLRWSASAEEEIHLVCGAPAEALGLDEDRGALLPGRLADLVVVPGDLRQDATALLRPVSVFRSGTEVASNGRLLPPSAVLEADMESWVAAAPDDADHPRVTAAASDAAGDGLGAIDP